MTTGSGRYLNGSAHRSWMSLAINVVVYKLENLERIFLTYAEILVCVCVLFEKNKIGSDFQY